MYDGIKLFLEWVGYFFIAYLIGYSTFLFLSVVVGSLELYKHRRQEMLKSILPSDYYLPISIIVPAYNEEVTVADTVLSDLSTYPIDGVKIDRSIVIESALPRARALLEGMIRLSHDMGIRVLCEGVEDKATCDAVLAAGCDFIQGFYFSRVLPGREAESFLRSLAARDREEG